MADSEITDPITQRLRLALFSAWRHKCAYCLIRPPEHVDHIFPAARGGEDRLENYVAACQTCNSMKSDLFLAEGYLRILQAKAEKMAPRIRARIAREVGKIADSDMMEALVTARMLSRHTRHQLSSLSEAQVQRLRDQERAEVLDEASDWSVRKVKAEISRLNKRTRGNAPRQVARRAHMEALRAQLTELMVQSGQAEQVAIDAVASSFPRPAIRKIRAEIRRFGAIPVLAAKARASQPAAG